MTHSANKIDELQARIEDLEAEIEGIQSDLDAAIDARSNYPNPTIEDDQYCDLDDNVIHWESCLEDAYVQLDEYKEDLEFELEAIQEEIGKIERNTLNINPLN